MAKKKTRRYVKHVNAVDIPEEYRGAILTKRLGLDKVKKERKPVVKETVKVENPYQKFEKKEFIFKPEDFEAVNFGSNIGYGIRHTSWSEETFITNEDRFISTDAEAVKFINDYCEDAAKPYGERGKLIIHLIPC